MYLTAQRVRSRDKTLLGTGSPGDTGISVAYYRHGHDMLPRLPTGVPDISRISTTEPGALVSSASEIPPGGNDVLSYLDVAAPDQISPDELQRHIGAVESQIAAAALPYTWEHGDMAVSFLVHGVIGDRARHEFAALKNRLLAHLRTTLNPTGRGDPFIAHLVRQDEALELQWLPATRQRLADLKFAAGRSIRISYDVADQYAASALPGPLIAHALAAIAGVDLHELVIRGGVRVVDGERTVWERLPE